MMRLFRTRYRCEARRMSPVRSPYLLTLPAIWTAGCLPQGLRLFSLCTDHAPGCCSPTSALCWAPLLCLFLVPLSYLYTCALPSMPLQPTSCVLSCFLHTEPPLGRLLDLRQFSVFNC